MVMPSKDFNIRAFTIKGVCCVCALGYLYVLKKYVALEYHHYKRKRSLIEHDAKPDQMNMIMVERFIKEKSQR
ncbi:putative integral membrane protein [Babesia bovis T2Bo]|uniref:putative integral membrane protein n=1 Tax=Babesia bovis T2Bo TaxID=484906 RepID=UPI001DFFBA27|nr:putative integral membrane protein [Babesia bovis T2Bo]KAG6439937.1 putative integral membrane protein [Babesia bovis T2Bo]